MLSIEDKAEVMKMIKTAKEELLTEIFNRDSGRFAEHLKTKANIADIENALCELDGE